MLYFQDYLRSSSLVNDVFKRHGIGLVTLQPEFALANFMAGTGMPLSTIIISATALFNNYLLFAAANNLFAEFNCQHQIKWHHVLVRFAYVKQHT